MKQNTRVLAFDADDTLWSNEPFFLDVEKQFVLLLENYGTPEQISAELLKTETDNLECLGYGAKAFTISMVETALRVSRRSVPGDVIREIIDLGKSLLKIPIYPIKGVAETLTLLKEKGSYMLIVATKGDQMDQTNKLRRSGLSHYFDHVEVLSDKKEADYLRLLERLDIVPEHFTMVGNSFKSDIAPVLAIGGYAVHIPFEIVWAHENTEAFDHPKLKCVDHFEDLASLF